MKNKIILLVGLLLSIQYSFAQNQLTVSELPKDAKQILDKYASLDINPEDKTIWEINFEQWSQKNFTITDHLGKVISFQARDLKEDEKFIFWYGQNSTTNSHTHFTINKKSKSMYGSISLSDGMYQINALQAEKILLIKERVFNNITCATKAPDLKGIPYEEHSRRSMPMPTLDCNLRIIIAFTTSAGSSAFDVEGWIRSQINLANLSYANSNIDFEIEIAHVYQTNYTETMTSETFCWIDGIPHPGTTTDLCRFHHVGDGHMDEVHPLRDKYKADACILIVDDLPNAGGQSFLPPIINQGEAFAVAALIGGSSYVVAHEIGHIQGCHHEYAQDPTATNNHGYVHVGADVASSFRTVMAYGVPCENEFGENCDRIPYFSHPYIYYNGVPIGETDPAGIDGARNAENIMNQKALILGFRNYPTNYVMDPDIVQNREFAFSVAKNQWTHLGLYETNANSRAFIYSENRISIKPGFHAKRGSQTQLKIETNCIPPEY